MWRKSPWLGVAKIQPRLSSDSVQSAIFTRNWFLRLHSDSDKTLISSGQAFWKQCLELCIFFCCRMFRILFFKRCLNGRVDKISVIEGVPHLAGRLRVWRTWFIHGRHSNSSLNDMVLFKSAIFSPNRCPCLFWLKENINVLEPSPMFLGCDSIACFSSFRSHKGVVRSITGVYYLPTQ